MNPNREELLFQLALTKPADERTAWLDRECLGDNALRARLEALVSAHEQPETLLAPQADTARPTLKLDLADEPDDAVGQTLGRYKLLERVGEGGCGVVYVAEQTEPVRRRVALKASSWAWTPSRSWPSSRRSGSLGQVAVPADCPTHSGLVETELSIEAGKRVFARGFSGEHAFEFVGSGFAQQVAFAEGTSQFFHPKDKVHRGAGAAFLAHRTAAAEQHFAVMEHETEVGHAGALEFTQGGDQGRRRLQVLGVHVISDCHSGNSWLNQGDD